MTLVYTCKKCGKKVVRAYSSTIDGVWKKLCLECWHKNEKKKTPKRTK